ncbi:hypothetical protein COV53_02865 [Candidatus Gottesmanbacteria bacterium CG11_big_fil_rev_8_21_14_0_20_37_11]|uniref:Peptidase S8/S53 domain-containing protein n=1 Tax=Candidatus Gottesmanbacteria bacterium CG11_big_fil_rev_8_21_14_0_20_37_11 TaxID=1974575 RepID=A0A2H0NHV4_9BACT|nr:MAG: hypothetical protein COV53_02865 [Candidatus Gottesmanbacteria bacterium CG11_big_fil_rev_8_21_14_0_20_37_11]
MQLTTEKSYVSLDMVKKFLLFFVIFSAFLLSSIPIYASDLLTNSENRRIIVKYKTGLSDPERLKFHRLNRLERISSIGRLNIDVLSVKPEVVNELILKMQGDPRVSYVEEDQIATVSEMTDDPALLENRQGNLYQIHAAGGDVSAWNYSKGSSSVLVAVVDTGIDEDHPDLSGKVDKETNCTDSYTPDDLYGHGTHVAGIISADTNNHLGIAGVGYNSRLLNAKALSDSGSGYYSWIADCISWAADNGADVINMSLSGTAYSRALEDAVNYAALKGAVLVAAAGNSGKSKPSYPAGFNNVIAVGAVDGQDNKASFSNWGRWVSVTAPGVSIYSTMPNHPNRIGGQNYGYMSGTSMASPHVSGLAALLFGLNGIEREQVISYIANYADRISGTGVYFLYGRINALASLKAAAADFVTPTLGAKEENITPTASYTVTPPVPTVTPEPTIIPPTTSTPTPVPTDTPTPTPVPPTEVPSNPWQRLCGRYPWLCK